MLRPRLARHAVAALSVLAAAACGRVAPGRARPPAVQPGDLAPLVRAHFGLPPVAVDVWAGQRIRVEITDAPWADSSAAVQFDRAYDVARLLWDRYGAAAGIDTISVRRAAPPPAPRASTEYFFYPKQLTARERPRLASPR